MAGRARKGEVSSGHWEFPLDLWRGYQLRIATELYDKSQADQQAMHQQVFDAFQAAQAPQAPAPVSGPMMAGNPNPFMNAPVPFDAAGLVPPTEPPPGFAPPVASTGAFDVVPQAPVDVPQPAIGPQPTPAHGFDDVWGN